MNPEPSRSKRDALPIELRSSESARRELNPYSTGCSVCLDHSATSAKYPPGDSNSQPPDPKSGASANLGYVGMWRKRGDSNSQRAMNHAAVFGTVSPTNRHSSKCERMDSNHRTRRSRFTAGRLCRLNYARDSPSRSRIEKQIVLSDSALPVCVRGRKGSFTGNNN